MKYNEAFNSILQLFLLYSKNVIGEDKVQEYLGKENISLPAKFAERKVASLPPEYADPFREFLEKYNLIKTKRASFGGARVNINTPTRHSKLVENGVNIPLEDYLELTNQIVEAQAKLNKFLRPRFELRVYIHEVKPAKVKLVN